MSDFGLLFGCSMAITVEIVTLSRVLYGSRHRFVIKILATLIGGNLARLASEIVWMNEIKTGVYSNKKQ